MDKKIKIINDPVHGFITIPSENILNIVQHPYFQRLRNIKQLGLTDLVFPGATHSRFHHALGAFHLMGIALKTLETKGVEISDEEREAALLAILLHDIGHGPFSHALEESIIGKTHEEISKLIINEMNTDGHHHLQLALSIFNNSYKKKFLHQLVSSQLDVDRLDYLSRDSFFTGVVEGLVGFERLLSLINVVDNQLVLEEKGIFSIEKFLIARRLMYWQVYLHKTVLGAEVLLKNIFQVAKMVSEKEGTINGSDVLSQFILKSARFDTMAPTSETLSLFCSLDDTDVYFSLKKWSQHRDPLLAFLSSSILNRNLYKTAIDSKDDFLLHKREKAHQWLKRKYNSIDLELEEYLLSRELVEDTSYQNGINGIKILKKDGTISDLSENIGVPLSDYLSTSVKKEFVFYFEDIG